MGETGMTTLQVDTTTHKRLKALQERTRIPLKYLVAQALALSTDEEIVRSFKDPNGAKGKGRK